MKDTFTRMMSGFFIATGFLIIINTQVHGQIINTIAGNGALGYSGDGIPATTAEFDHLDGAAVDNFYNVYVGDQLNNRVREISGGFIYSVAGNGTAGYSGDGILATNAELNSPTGVAVDDSGNVYIDDFEGARIRKVTKVTGIISTIAGTGIQGYSGDGIPATSSEVDLPCGVAVDDSGNVYIADTYGCRIRKVTKSTGIISTVAGTGTYGISANGIVATSAQITDPWSVAVDDSGNIYISDTYSDRIRKVISSTGIITTIAGDGVGGYSGDGGPATDAEIYLPTQVTLDAYGNVYFDDFGNEVVRKITVSTGIITTAAGDGNDGFSGDGGPATDAELSLPWGVAVDQCSNIYITDQSNERVREVFVDAIPDVKITPNTVSVCSGGSVTLTASGASNYTWSPAVGLSATSGSSVAVNPTISTTYTIIGVNNCSRADTATISVSIISSPPLVIQPQSPSVCPEQGVTLSVPISGSNYIWSPASTLSSSTGYSVIVTTSVTTTYLVTGSNSSGCAVTGTDTVKIYSDTLTIEPLSPSVCPGQGITLSVPVSGSDYLWSPASSLSATQGNTVIATPTITTTYMVTGVDSLNCSVSALDTIYVSNAPNKPTITTKGAVLTSSATQGNQWVRNDTVLQGVTNQTYTVTMAGWYEVIAGNPANGCSTTSDSVYINPTGINRLSAEGEQVTVYPNPTGGEINVTISSSVGEVKDWNLQVIDVLGRTVYTKLSLNYSNDIDLSNLSSGVYFICVINNTGRVVMPVVKQN